MQGLWTIGELTREFGVSTRTLRFYEDEGLIEPTRRGRRRLYPQRERTRLMLILRGKRLGFSLSEIAEILDIYERAPGERRELRRLLDRIRERRAQLDQKRRDIDIMLAELDRVEAGCAARIADIDGAGEGAGGGSL